MCGDIRLGEEREMRTENYMWKWMLESHFYHKILIKAVITSFL